MEKQLAAGMAPQIRRQYLNDNCDKLEEVGYMKPFSPEEIITMKDQLSEVAIVINDFEIKRKEMMDEIKAEVKPLTEAKKTLLKNIKQKAEFVSEQCYKFIDQESKEVGFYNAEGTLVESRPIRQDETQMVIKMPKTGTNN